MFGWGRDKDGFEWRKYVRTTILIRRERRRQRIDDARVAAIDGLKDAGRKGAAAGVSGLQKAFDVAVEAIGRVIPSVHAAADRVRPRVAALGERIAEGLAPALRSMPWPSPRVLLLAAAAVALYAVLRKVPLASLELSAVTAPWLAAAAALVALGAMVLTRSPARPYNWLADVFWRIGHRISLIPGISSVTPKAAATATLAATLAGAGYLIWSDTDPAAAIAGLGAPAAPAAVAAPSKVSGYAAVVSGDSLRISGYALRLAGVEAPDTGQQCQRDGAKRWKCGLAAKQALLKLIGGQTVVCDTGSRDKAGLLVATCYVKDKDLGAELVRGGHVFSSGGLFTAYSGLESEAKSARVGVWSGSNDRPADYRAKRWEEAKRTAPEGCPIKGQVSSGSRVYVLPWSPRYDHIKIKSTRGERWFCSEQEAQSAGWRPVEQS